jgi:hypothetical protein
MRQCSRGIFLKCGLGVCSAGALIPPLSARPVMPYYKAVFDQRFGLTTSASPFCLHVLARDRGMRLHFCRRKPNMKAVLGVLDGWLPRDRMRMHLPSSAPSDLALWIIAPGARAATKEIAIA